MTLRIAVACAPFLLSAGILGFGRYVETYVEGVSRLILAQEIRPSSPVHRMTVRVGYYVYRQLGFILNTLISFLATTSIAALFNPLIVIVSLLAFSLTILLWLLHWQHLSPDELDGKKGRAMTTCSWAVLAIQWVLAVTVMPISTS